MRLRNVYFALALCATVHAQEFRATISGRVTDAQNSVIAGVKIIAVQIDTGAKFETTSDGEGIYSLPFLPPATYKLTAEAPGFKKYQRERLPAASNERVGVDIQLELGDVTETNNVSSEAAILQTASASTGQVITSAQIENMPVSGRTRLRWLSWHSV